MGVKASVMDVAGMPGQFVGQIIEKLQETVTFGAPAQPTCKLLLN
jgi:hypothetical protein